MPAIIHPTACIDPAATLGRDVTIGPFCVVERDVIVGDGCVLGPHVTVLAHTELGPRVRAHANAVIGDLPQDLAFEAATVSHVRVGEGTVLREGVTVHRGTKPGSATTIGRGCLLMANSHVAHNCALGDAVILANGVLLGGYAQIADRAFLSGNCAVHQFCRVGRLAMMSGLSAISKDLPPFCVAHNTSTNKVAGLNVVGMRRAGIGPEARSAVKQAFKLLYTSGLNVRDALAQMEPLRVVPEVEEFAAFLAASTRGVCSYAGGSGGGEGE